MQTTVTQVELRDIRGPKPEHVDVTLDNAGEVRALCWLYETSDRGLYRMAKSRGGIWDRDAGGWTFSSPEIARSLLDAIAARHPDWPILGLGEIKWLAGVSIARRVLGKLGYCVFPLGLPYFSRLAGNEVKIYKISRGTQKIGVAVGDEVQIEAFAEMLLGQGAGEEETMLEEWGFHGQNSPLLISTAGWAVEIVCDLGNPAHFLLHEQKYEWVGNWPNSVRKAIPWGGVINTTRKAWPGLKDLLEASGLEWKGDDPAQEITITASITASFQPERIPGWCAPTVGGQQLHHYQREGVEFCARRGMRALIGDEMGVGKTAQAIAAAEGTGAQRILIVCPANARYVWEREIQGWSRDGGIQHITSQLDVLDNSARWHIVTYDLLAARAESWRFLDEQEKLAFAAAFPDRAEEVKNDKVTLDQATSVVPGFINPKRVATWNKVMQRLRGELLEQLAATGALLIVDEAHRGKNKNAKRSKAIARLAATGGGVLLLTGTPLRNHAGEAARLLGYLDPQASVDLDKERGYTVQDVQDYLSYFMIRRTKAEVLPELPEKTRQRVDLDRLDPNEVESYYQHLQFARQCYEDALDEGAGEDAARQAAQGGIEMARSALGLAKVRGGAVAELVAGVVEDRGCCVVFSAHHNVSDELQHQLQKAGVEATIIDGRTGQQERARIVQEFQQGSQWQVIIGGINAAGEAITLTRADTVIFIELDWVPAALLQAEDRIHRVGQKNACQIVHAVAKLAGENLDELMIDTLGSKLSTIGQVLGEDGGNIVAGAGIRADILRQLLKAGATTEPALA
ncbi:MAG: DEAD/DEAH box helicase [Rhodocyclaceae bacterium]|nr:DEAD/DEAH box helicase [Rhodocyclaceae bacterium]